MNDDGVARSAAGRPAHPIANGSPTAYRCLLDLDADLAEAVCADKRRVARAAATALIVDADAGPVGVSTWLGQTVDGPGVLVLGGVLALTVRVGDRVSAELVGAGDLLAPPTGHSEELLSCAVCWRALTAVRFALLDGSFARRVRFWPELGQALLRRAAQRAITLDVQRAITAQPRLEVRLALLLWHLAGRWGKVERGGIRLPVPLTHQLLGQLVAAERPSVSHALARLAHWGVITGHGDEWHLHGSLEEQLPAVVHDSNGRAEHIVAALDRHRRAGAAGRA